MQKILRTLLCLLFFLSSCHSHKRIKSDSYTLKPADTQLAFPLDERTKIYIYSLQLYTDPNGEEFLVFQNENYEQLLFYKIKDQQLYKKIDCERQGPNGVRHFSGFFVRNMDEIYLTHSEPSGISVINGQGIPIKTYKNKNKKGETVKNELMATWNPIYQIGNNLYIPLGINREYGEDVKFHRSNLNATLNLENENFELHPLHYFDIIEREDDNLISIYYSRCTNGKQFIYSFEESEGLYVTDLAHTTLKKIKVKSKYLPSFKFKPQKFTMAGATNCISVENPRYGMILYDPYRKVYYWVAYPKVEIEKGINCFELSSFGGKNFSIMILNEDFEIIGETLMPDYTYNPTLCFIRKDGLYISESHVLNPNFDENKLCFRRFELIEYK